MGQSSSSELIIAQLVKNLPAIYEICLQDPATDPCLEPPLILVLNQMNEVYILISYLLMTDFNINLSSTPTSFI
jgi:hypothetical protein